MLPLTMLLVSAGIVFRKIPAVFLAQKSYYPNKPLGVIKVRVEEPFSKTIKYTFFDGEIIK